MTGSTPPQPPAPDVADAADSSLRRIGAVARMLRMPVATLRVWERRYGLTQTSLSPSGQRRYSADDVRRLALIKQLTELGHAIGSLAPLDMPQLQQVAATHARTLSLARQHDDAAGSELSAMRPWRLAVIGVAWSARLQRPALLRHLKQPLQLLGPFDSIAQAAASLQGQSLDALLIHEPQLHAGWLASLEAAAPALAGVPKAVLYGFAADAMCESLAAVGMTLLRDPQPDIVLAQWLHHFAAATTSSRQAAAPAPTAEQAAPARRWDDAALVDFASRSSTVACECPRHVAELLMQLSHFESYSAECQNRSPADAELHAYLAQVAGAARARFEAALERIALHEGLLLP